jgi:phenol 2-monooxygenase
MDEGGINMEEFKRAFEKGQMFVSGIGVNYGASMIVAKDGDTTSQGDGTDVSGNADAAHGPRVVGNQSLSSVIKLGMRMPSYQVLNQADARPWQFQERLKSDGRWRVVVFAGDIKNPTQSARVQALGEALYQPKSFLRRCTAADAPIDSVVEILTIHSSPRREVELLSDFHEIFHPFQKGVGWDYWKVYADDASYHEGHGQAYKNYDVDPQRGCMVVLRPDMYVSWIGELEEAKDLEAFFDKFLLPAN